MRDDQAPSATILPPGWQVEMQADGSARVYQTNNARAKTWGCYGPFAIIWNAWILLMIAAAYGILPGTWELEGYGAGWGLLPLLPFALLGLGFTHAAFWGRYGSDEWYASHNALEHRTGWQFSSNRKSQRYVDGTWEVRELSNEDQIYHDLCFKCPASWLHQGCIWQTNWGPTCTPQQLRELALVLSRHTGWVLTLPPGLDFTESY